MTAPADEGGEAACLLPLVCDHCGAVPDDGGHTCRSAEPPPFQDGDVRAPGR